jgi:hypothetical protein
LGHADSDEPWTRPQLYSLWLNLGKFSKTGWTAHAFCYRYEQLLAVRVVLGGPQNQLIILSQEDRDILGQKHAIPCQVANHNDAELDHGIQPFLEFREFIQPEQEFFCWNEPESFVRQLLG